MTVNITPIALGTALNDGTGDKARTAGVKINLNLQALADALNAFLGSIVSTNQLVPAVASGTRKIIVIDDTGNFATMTLASQLTWQQANDGSIDPFAQSVASAVESGMTIPTYRADGSVVRLPVALLSNASGGVATAFSLATSASSVVVGSSVNLLVMPTGAAWPSGVVVTPTSSIAGTFSPASASPTGSATVTFAFTPSASGSATLNASTASPTMTSGGSVPLTVSAAPSGRPSLTLSSPTFGTSKFGQGLSGGTATSPAITAGSGAGLGFWFVATSGNPYATILQVLGFGSFGVSFGGADLTGDATNHPVSSSSGPGATSAPVICDGTQHWVYADNNGGTINAYVDGTAFRTENRLLGSSLTVTLAPADLAGCVISELALWGTSDTTRKTPPTAQLDASDMRLLALWRLNGNGSSA